MKRTVRLGVFETNSSSTHSITIVLEEDFEKWKEGKLIFDKEEGKLVEDIGQAREKAILDCDGYCYDCYRSDECEYHTSEVQTYEQWKEDRFLTSYDEHTTLQDGTKVVAFGRYGYDG